MTLINTSTYEVYIVRMTFWDRLNHLSVTFIHSNNQIVYDYDDFKNEEKIVVQNCEMIPCFTLSTNDIEKINQFFDILAEMISDSIVIAYEE